MRFRFSQSSWQRGRHRCTPLTKVLSGENSNVQRRQKRSFKSGERPAKNGNKNSQQNGKCQKRDAEKKKKANKSFHEKVNF